MPLLHNFVKNDVHPFPYRSHDDCQRGCLPGFHSQSGQVNTYFVDTTTRSIMWHFPHHHNLNLHTYHLPLTNRTLRVSARAAATSSATGDAGTESFRLVFSEGGKTVSPWHDIPLKSGDLFNFVNEIPKYTKAKMEVSTKEASNPIAQDIKKGKLRDYHGPIFWNYGCLPQTWEDPNIEHPVVKCKGDNDPVDVVEIGSAALASGTVCTVKVLGVLAMIDDGELDWKVIAINSADPLAAKLNDIEDVDKHCPGVVSGEYMHRNFHNK